MSLPGDLAFASATELARAIRERRASAREVLQAHLARIDRIDGELGSIVRRDDERARVRAQAADDALARGVSWGPLHGVPFTLKDQHDVAGLSSSFGAKGTERAAMGDGVVAERLLAAGGILLGKTQMALNVQGLSGLHGRVANPWDPRRVAGGSSGGAAAAVSARLTPFDIGADTSGSVRMPAHFCGTFGLRPTIGRIPSVGMEGAIPGVPRLGRDAGTAGPIARTAEDIALLLGVLAGPHRRDPFVPPVPLSGVPPIEPRALRVAFVASWPGIPITASSREVLESAARRLAGAGARIEEVPPPFAFSEVLATFRALFRPGIEAISRAGLAPPGTKSAEAPMTALEWLVARDQSDRLLESFDGWLGDRDALLCPTSISAAFAAGPLGAPVDVDGEAVPSTAVDHACLLATVLGAPALVVPAGRDELGLPVGAQLVGRRWDDCRVVAAGATISSVLGALPPPPFATGGAP